MNVLPLPTQFDLNEWCAIGLTVLVFIIIYFLPKRLKTGTILVIWLFNINLVKITDFTFGVKPFDLYNFMDQPKFELVYNVIHYTFYPAVAYLILYIYDVLNIKKAGTVFYLVIISLILLILEWLALKVHILEYVNGRWNLFLSFFVYIACFAVNINLFNYVQRLLNKSEK